jgi:hypothetical protein
MSDNNQPISSSDLPVIAKAYMRERFGIRPEDIEDRALYYQQLGMVSDALHYAFEEWTRNEKP